MCGKRAVCRLQRLPLMIVTHKARYGPVLECMQASAPARITLQAGGT